MSLVQLIQLGVVWGTVLGVVFSVAVLALGWIDLGMLIKEYPPDVQAKVGPISASTQKRAGRWGIWLLLVFVVVIASGLTRLRAASGELRFGETLLVSTVIFQSWNLLDLVLLDWLLLMKLRPRFMIFPGTDELAGYRDLTFHVRKFGRGIVLTMILAMFVTVLVCGIEWLI